MNKKKVLFTSLAALTLTSFAGTVGVKAEELTAVDDTVAVTSTTATETLVPNQMQDIAISEVRDVAVTTASNFDGSQVVFDISLTDPTHANDQRAIYFTNYIVSSSGELVEQALFSTLASEEENISQTHYTTALADGDYRVETRGVDDDFFAHSTIADAYILYKGSADFSVANGRVVEKQVVELPPVEEVPVEEPLVEQPTEEPVVEAPQEEPVVEAPQVEDQPVTNPETVETSNAINETEQVQPEEVIAKPETPEVSSSQEEGLTPVEPVAETPVTEKTEPISQEQTTAVTEAKTDAPAEAPAQVKDVSAPVKETVKVPVTVTAEKSPAPVKESKPAKASYSRTEKAQSEKGILPSTGEVTSILGAIGASLSAFGLVGLRRRK